MKLKILKLSCCLFILASAFLATNAGAYSLGEMISFSVDPSYDSANRVAVAATLLYTGDKSLFYVENNWWNGLTNRKDTEVLIFNLFNEFEKIIYPRLTQVFGSEWSPGIDKEPRITILITKMKEGTGGYFNSGDEYPKSQSPNSNEREMIYLNSAYLELSRSRGFLAHEFQHLINFYQKEKLRNLTEEVWLNEARSEYASTVCGYDDVYSGSNLERRVNEFLRNPSDSLTEWENKAEDYGSANLFMQYLVSRYGEVILSEMVQADSVGIVSINKALVRLGSADQFPEIFANWTVANYINDCQLGDGQKFCYLNPRLPPGRFRLNPTTSNVLANKDGVSFSFSDNVKDWAGHWYAILTTGTGNLNLILSFVGGENSNFQVPLFIYYTNGAKSLRYLKLNNRVGADIIVNFPDTVREAVLIPSGQTKLSGFSASEPTYAFSFTATITSVDQIPFLILNPSYPSPTHSVAPAPVSAPTYPDGSLVRAAGDYRVFIVHGKYKRWIQSPAILAAYPHLGWQSIIEVTPADCDWYQDAWLIRADGDYKVYEINGDFSKHWLNMSAEQFIISGRKWDMVFVVNKTERDLYRTGADALK